MLADFGSTRITTTPVEMSSKEQGTASFTAPELLFPTDFGLKKGVPSKEADIYALGMTVYQVLTGKCPFFPMREAEVTHAVALGERPRKPENAESIGMTGVVWDLLRECWKENRTTRPTIVEVLKGFCEITSEKKTTDSTLRGLAAPRLNTGKHSSPISQVSSSTAVSCERTFLCSLYAHCPADGIDGVHCSSFSSLGDRRDVSRVRRYYSFESIRFPPPGECTRDRGGKSGKRRQRDQDQQGPAVDVGSNRPHNENERGLRSQETQREKLFRRSDIPCQSLRARVSQG